MGRDAAYNRVVAPRKFPKLLATLALAVPNPVVISTVPPIPKVTAAYRTGKWYKQRRALIWWLYRFEGISPRPLSRDWHLIAAGLRH